MKDINGALWEGDKKEKRANVIFFSVASIILAIMCAFVVLNTFVFVNIQVEGDSMCDTLKSGQLLIANKTKDPEIGDIVIITKGDYWIIKRVIGKEGDLIEIKNNKVFRNGEEVVEPYAKGKTFSYGIKSWQIPKNHVFYLGDNREYSLDSRINGPCSEKAVIGVVEDWSMDDSSIIKGIYFLPMQIAGLFGSSCAGSAN